MRVYLNTHFVTPWCKVYMAELISHAGVCRHDMFDRRERCNPDTLHIYFPTQAIPKSAP